MVCEKVHSIRFEPYCFLTPSLLEEQVCALHNTSGTVYSCMCVWSSLMDHIKPQVGYNACLLGLNPEVCLLWYRDEPLVKGPSITDTSHIKIVVLLEWANPPTNHGVCVCAAHSAYRELFPGSTSCHGKPLFTAVLPVLNTHDSNIA